MLVTARRLDVDRKAAGLREAREHVGGQSGVVLQLQLRRRSAAEVDRGAGEGVVHRDDRVAVAGDPPPVAQRRVESLP